MQAIIKSNQWLGDLAIVHTGSIESLMELAKLNDLSITDELEAGKEIEVKNVLQGSIKNEFERSNIIPATGIRSSQVIDPGGIGYMIVNVDFVISTGSI